MTRSKSRTRALVSIGAASSLLFLAACGSDSDDAGSASTEAPAASEAPADTAAATDAPADTEMAEDTAPADTTPADTTLGDSAEPVAAGDPCETWIAADTAIIQFLFAGAGTAESVEAALDAAIASAPDENVDTLTSLKEGAEAQLQDPSQDASEETLQLYSDAIAWAGGACDVETIDVTAMEYHYEGIPTELSTGYKVLNFTNEGNEAHEIFAFRINDGVTETVEELLALPEEEVMGKITPVNAGFATPGTTEVVSWDLTESGQYAAVCFVSVGSVGETEGEGPPHFTQGMVHEFTVA